MKVRRLLLAAALAAAAPAFAQQNVDISGADFQSGGGDGKLAAVGRAAAKSGKRVVVTAPQEWHARIAAKIRAGGAADVVMKDGFYENVLVRVEDKPAEPPKPEPKPEPKRVASERVPVDVPGPKPTLPPPPEPEPAPPAPVVKAPAPVAAAAPPPVQTAPAPAPAQTPPPAAPQVAVAKPAATAPAQPDVAKIQKRMEESLNNGREAEGPLSVSGLQSGDFIFVDGPVRAVVRRESLRPRMFWLDGELDLRRAELKELGTNRYQVINPISGGTNYALREDRSADAKSLVAAVPPENSPGRATFERDYNDGHSIDETIAVEKLRSADLVYTGKGMAVVVRREGPKLTRYWLDGTLDLGQPGLLKDGSNKYKVISDTIH
jgi:outer membrane biosynthesis protein TonB